MAARRRRLVVGGLAVGLVVLLFGRGLGLLPSAGDSGTLTPAPDVPPDAATTLPETRAPEAQAPDPAAHAPAPAANAVPGPEPAVDPAAAAAAADRLHSLGSTLRSAVAGGHLGAGFAALAALDGAGAGAGAPGAALRAELEGALREAITTVADDLRQGRALSAHRRIQLMLEQDPGPVRAGLDALCQRHGWPSLTAGAREGHVPRAEPMPRDRAVRVFRRGDAVIGRVVDARPMEVTVRVADQGGVTFPSFPVTEVEPLQVDAGIAVELGLAALRAGDVPLARAWLVCTLAVGGGERQAADRMAELRMLLP